MFAAAEAAGTGRTARYFAIVSGELSAAAPIEAVATKNRQLQKNDFKPQTETRVHREMFKRWISHARQSRANQPLAQEFCDWFDRFDMSAEDFESGQDRNGEDHTGHAPHPAPER